MTIGMSHRLDHRNLESARGATQARRRRCRAYVVAKTCGSTEKSSRRR